MNYIHIFQGDATIATETITGMVTLAGYTGKLYITTNTGAAIDTITGTVAGLTVAYAIVNEDSKLYPVGTHRFETKLFDAADHVYTPSQGLFVVERAIEEDPV
jgi:hypothetical protein